MATKAIPVNAAKVAATLADYPAYVKPSAMTGWGALTLAEAQSIRFYSDEALTTELTREVVSADEIHVKVPSLTTTTIIYADYDGVRADYAVTDTYGRNAVWGDYGLVQHFESNTNDSTSNGLNGVDTSVSYTAAEIGNGASYNGTTSVTKTNFDIPTSFTNSFWIRPGNNSGTILAKDVNSSLRYIDYNYFNTSNTIGFYTWNSAGAIKLIVAGSIEHDTWYKVDVKWNSAGNNTYYINGVEGSTDNNVATGGNARNSTAYDLWYGARQYTGSFYPQSQILDEMRWTSSLRSADWITTEYNNQSDVASFWGTVTDVGGGPTPNNSARRMLLMGM